MRRKSLVTLATSLAVGLALAMPTTAGSAPAPLKLQEFRVADSVMQDITQEWMADLHAKHRPGTWAPMKFTPTDDQLKRMGLPSSKVLLSRRYPKPTMIMPDGSAEIVDLPAVTTFAGAGWFGIRPGAWLLLLNDGGIGWCSMAHVYGSPGSYSISTAGHCGKTGDIGTVIAAFGNRNGTLNPILLDFGTFKTSNDGGLGRDWALISVYSQYQNLVTPTMCFWGGPRGMYTKVGDLANVTFRRKSWIPSVTVTPDPYLAQTIVHYGHGTGVGAGGTPRAGEAISWRSSHFMFFGAISPGDSGSGANTLTGDTVGANMEAAGIMTHLWIDPLMRSGLGIMGGTRATQVNATLANGQIVSYPVPISGLP